MPLPTSVPETAESAFQRVLGTAQSVSSNLRGVGDLAKLVPLATLIATALATFV